jgi:hypothetical protein
MIIKFGKIATGADVIRFELGGDSHRWLMGNYSVPDGWRSGSEFCMAEIDEDVMKTLYLTLHEYFKERKFNVCKRDEILSKHLKDKPEEPA